MRHLGIAAVACAALLGGSALTQTAHAGTAHHHSKTSAPQSHKVATTPAPGPCQPAARNSGLALLGMTAGSGGGVGSGCGGSAATLPDPGGMDQCNNMLGGLGLAALGLGFDSGRGFGVGCGLAGGVGGL
jgi:hypothetical protein